MTANTLPLFPLQSVFFPDGYLPLRIFEVRYLDMISRCQKNGEPFGVVSLIEGTEVRQRDAASSGEGFAHERFSPIGTLAQIEHFARPQPGLIHVRCRGGQRFRLLGCEQLPHGLWIGQAELIEADAVVPVPDDLAATAQLLQGLLHKLELGAAIDDLPIQPPYRWGDSGWVANRWCELLPLPGAERQRLMQLDNPLLRLELVADQLDRLGLHQAL